MQGTPCVQDSSNLIQLNFNTNKIIHMMCMIMFNYDKCTLCVILIIVDIYIIYASML